jgi:hypothetical protein
MPQILLHNGMSAAVDEADYEQLAPYRWQATCSSGRVWYAIRSVNDAGKTRTIHMHRQIMAPSAGMLVDHINRDGLDNRRENLRLATPSQSNANRILPSANCFRGIKRRGTKWHAKIQISRRGYFLGSYETAEEAARAYDRAAFENYGEFARLNFPEVCHAL